MTIYVKYSIAFSCQGPKHKVQALDKFHMHFRPVSPLLLSILQPFIACFSQVMQHCPDISLRRALA